MKYVAIGENHLYQKAYTRGAKAGARTVVVYCLRDYAAARLQKANPEKKKLNRIGLTVTKKIGGAVTRSRVKRILREGYRQVEKNTPIKKGFLIVLVARDAAVKAKSQDIAADLAYAMRKLGMLEGMPFPPKQPKPGANGR
ncbi:MAG: ribonuclease P protein component [Clostridia bacterium]|nr:ribonuclease P protein component [Clostridia bacterium]